MNNPPLPSDLATALTQIAHERELRELTAAWSEKALALQAKEYERRLVDLNHAHAQAQENWRTSLPREMFDQWRIEHSVWRESVNTALVLMNATRDQVTHLSGRVTSIEVLAQRLNGALILVGLMGAAGVLALLLGLARLAGFVP